MGKKLKTKFIMKTIEKHTCKDGFTWYEVDFGTYKILSLNMWEMLSQIFNQKLSLN